MRTAMATTSIDAYHLFSTVDLQRKEIEMMAWFTSTPGLTVTREQLADLLGWKEAAVCGRANSLVAKGVLEEIDGGITRSGRSAKQLRLPVAGQQELFLMTATEASGQRNTAHVGTPSPYNGLNGRAVNE